MSVKIDPPLIIHPIVKQPNPPNVALVANKYGDFRNKQIPVREYVIDGLLPTKGIGMLFSWRGVGKTHFMIVISMMVACGGSFLSWSAPKPRRVLHIDGEMDQKELQQWMKEAEALFPGREEFIAENLTVLLADEQSDGLPDLATVKGQDVIQPYVDTHEVIMVDNISTTMRSYEDTRPESWVPAGEWAKTNRRNGKTTFFAHHEGKSGEQRGGANKEDPMNIIIHLTRPKSHLPQTGLNVDVNYTKSRGARSNATKPFNAVLSVIDGKAIWTTRDTDVTKKEWIADLNSKGWSVGDISTEVGVTKSYVYQILKMSRPKGRKPRAR